MSFIAKAFSEADGTPSSTRISLAILLLFTMTLISIAFYLSVPKLPEVPASLSDLIKFLFGAGTARVAVGPVADAIKSYVNRSSDAAPPKNIA